MYFFKLRFVVDFLAEVSSCGEKSILTFHSEISFIMNFCKLRKANY